MSATLTTPPLSLFSTPTSVSPPPPARTRAASTRRLPAGGRPTTLEERLGHTWHELAHTGEAECPMCHTAMRPDGGAGRCTGCGTTLS